MSLRSNTMTESEWAKYESLTWENFEVCPFCGKRNAELILDITHKKINPRIINRDYASPFCVECVNCGARAGADLDPDKAIENWNKRVKGEST